MSNKRRERADPFFPTENGYKALLIEPEGVPNTGDVESEMTIAKVERV